MKIGNAIKTAALACAAVFGSTAANAQAIQFFAVLDGGNEVSAGGAAAAGDLNGNGVASILLGGSGQLCFSLLVRGIANPTVAHIHSALPGASGPISIALTPVPSSGVLGSSSGCLSGLPAATINQIRLNPGRFYVNVHNGPFPSGAIRGQLF
jgi:hypothetical protein